MIGQGLGELAYTDPARFKAIEAQLAKLEASSKAIDDPNNKINKTITEFCERRGISEHTVFQILGEKNGIERENMIHELLHNQLTFCQKVFSERRMAFNKTEAKTIARLKIQADKVLADNDLLAKNAGALLYTLVSKDEKWRNALVRAQNKEKPTFKDGIESNAAFDDIKGKGQKGPDLKRVEDGWKEFLTNHNVNDFSTVPARTQAIYQDRFKKQYAADAAKAKKGFWGTVLSYLLRRKMNAPEVDAILK